MDAAKTLLGENERIQQLACFATCGLKATQASSCNILLPAVPSFPPNNSRLPIF